MKSKSFPFWITVFVIAYSTYDYLEHILREGSVFETHPFDWFLFTATSILGLIVSVIGIYLALKSFSDNKYLLIVFELIGIGTWIPLHLNLIGPVANKLFWPHNELYFQFNFGPFFIILAIYFGIRLLFQLLANRISRLIS